MIRLWLLVATASTLLALIAPSFCEPRYIRVEASFSNTPPIADLRGRFAGV